MKNLKGEETSWKFRLSQSKFNEKPILSGRVSGLYLISGFYSQVNNKVNNNNL